MAGDNVNVDYRIYLRSRDEQVVCPINIHLDDLLSISLDKWIGMWIDGFEVVRWLINDLECAVNSFSDNFFGNDHRQIILLVEV